MIIHAEEPWIVLEYLPHGDLKTFLKVWATVNNYHATAACMLFIIVEKQETNWQVNEIYAGCCHWDALHL